MGRMSDVHIDMQETGDSAEVCLDRAVKTVTKRLGSRYYVNLGGHVRRFGAGWRCVELLSVGRKWAKLRYSPKSVVDGTPLFTFRGRVHKDIWAKLPKKELN